MPGVIEDENVTFTETGARPDSLEQAVSGAEGSAGSGSKIVGGGLLNPGATERVWEAYKSLCSTLYEGKHPPIEDCYKEIVVNFLQLKYQPDSSNYKAHFSLGNFTPESLIRCLQSTHGDYIAETDIGDAIKAGVTNGKVSDEVTALFPELQALSQLRSTNYFLGDGKSTLLFAGVNFNALAIVTATNHEKEKLGRYVVKYAQQIKEKNLIPILRELQRIPVKT
ncbi:hypothetical protein HZC30_02070 [Candidatus Woesearchaeota archaeon]|nr:hypothetical protein [Candidatus Woesearchaeota archaeon]